MSKKKFFLNGYLLLFEQKMKMKIDIVYVIVMYYLNIKW